MVMFEGGGEDFRQVVREYIGPHCSGAISRLAPLVLSESKRVEEEIRAELEGLGVLGEVPRAAIQAGALSYFVMVSSLYESAYGSLLASGVMDPASAEAVVEEIRREIGCRLSSVMRDVSDNGGSDR